VVFLRYFADLSYAEIARLCGIEEGTVAATLAQAHAELKLALEGTEVR
jgi:DNA-directed RNA polymerase specialized sigma24 family protein